MPTTGPDFDAWVTYCFTRGYREFSGEIEAEHDVRLSPQLTADFMLRLCESPAFLADRFTDEQLADGVWFVFGVSGFTHDVLFRCASEDMRRRFLRSVGTLYTELFDRVCGDRGRVPNDKRSNEHRLDMAVYMLWDMGGLCWSPLHDPELNEPMEALFEHVLTTCTASACLESALHGLGHAIELFEHDQPNPVVDRVHAMIDRFLADRRPPAWLAEYARQARVPLIQ